MNPHIFRAYDIRGVVDEDLTAPVVRALGWAIAAGVCAIRQGHGPGAAQGGEPAEGAGAVALGWDCRLHSERVAGWLADGIVAGGVDVREIGMGPTPALYHAAGEGHGVMITGSHNPPEYNGFKIVLGGRALHGEGIARLCADTLKQLPAAESRHGSAGPDGAPNGSGVGVRRADSGAMGRYAAAIVAGCQPAVRGDGRASVRGDRRGLKVVVDAGNGAAGPLSVQVFRELGHRVVELFCEPDGRFPNHHPDPSLPENLRDLCERVVAEGADLGLAFDGDGDRLGVVDGEGEIVPADRLAALLARKILEDRPGATILGEVKCSDVFFDDVRRHGGRAEMGQVGHSLVKAAMRRTGAVFAAELSGHLFFADRWFGFDDALYAGARVLELVGGAAAGGGAGAGGADLAALLGDLPTTFATPELRVDCPDDRKFDVVERVRRELYERATVAAEGPDGEGWELVAIDGVRLRAPGGWGLVRASNTQPALVCRVEGETPERRDEILGWLSEALEVAGLGGAALAAPGSTAP